MKAGHMNDRKNDKSTGITTADCIHRISSKFKLKPEEIRKIYQLDQFNITRVFMTEEGSFDTKTGKYTSKNIPGNGKVCIQYFNDQAKSLYLTLQKIPTNEGMPEASSTLYELIEKSIGFFEKAQRASKRLFFQRLFNRHKILCLSYITDLNSVFEKSHHHRDTDEVALSNTIFVLQKKGRFYVMEKAIRLEEKLLEQIEKMLESVNKNDKRQTLLKFKSNLIQHLQELKSIHNSVLLH